MRRATRTVRGLRGLRGEGGGGTAAPPLLGALALSPSTLNENSVENTVVGALLGMTVGSTLTMTNTAGSRFKLTGTNVVAGSVATDFEAATSHNITMQETKAGIANSPRDTILLISVLNVGETTLAMLGLSASSIIENSPVNTFVGNITGLTAGSTVVMQNSAGSRFKISGTTVVADTTATDFETAPSHNITLRETHPDGTNSPRDSMFVISVGNIDDTAPFITSSATVSVAEGSSLLHTLTADEAVTWTLVGGVDQAKFEIAGTTLRWLANGSKDFELPDDSNLDNVYIVQVRATDAALNATNQTVTVSVTNVVEGLDELPYYVMMFG